LCENFGALIGVQVGGPCLHTDLLGEREMEG